jgi:hypothetical protein
MILPPLAANASTCGRPSSMVMILPLVNTKSGGSGSGAVAQAPRISRQEDSSPTLRAEGMNEANRQLLGNRGDCGERSFGAVVFRAAVFGEAVFRAAGMDDLLKGVLKMR